MIPSSVVAVEATAVTDVPGARWVLAATGQLGSAGHPLLSPTAVEIVFVLVGLAVLGAGHAQRTAAKRTAFNEDFFKIIARLAWGEVWSRPGLALTETRAGISTEPAKPPPRSGLARS